MKKKVLILVNHDIVIYNFRKELVERLLSEKFDVYISSPNGERIKYLTDMGASFIETKLERHGLNPINDLKLINFYKKIIKNIKPNVVLTYTIKPNIYGGIAAKSLGIPYIANITGLGTAVENKGLLQKITVLLYKYAFKNIKTIFFQNEENMDFFLKNDIATNTHKLLPGSGVNLKEFLPIEYPSEKSIEFVFISRIMKEKGIDQYLDAATYITNKYSNVKFHICGFCEEEYEQILEEYQKNGIILYHGLINDVRDILKITHCTIHPTYYPEGMSNVLLESCASARPIITTDRSGCREIVDDERNGFVVNQKDSKDLIDKVEKFIKLSYKEKKQMGLEARKKVEQCFSRDIVVNLYMEEIHGCSNSPIKRGN